MVEALERLFRAAALAGAIIPELVKAFTSTDRAHVKKLLPQPKKAAHRSEFCRASLLATSPRTTSVWQWFVLMSAGYLISNMGLGNQMIAAPVFAFGLVAFGFLGMGPVTIAVDSYGPVTTTRNPFTNCRSSNRFLTSRRI